MAWPVTRLIPLLLCWLLAPASALRLNPLATEAPRSRRDACTTLSAVLFSAPLVASPGRATAAAAPPAATHKAETATAGDLLCYEVKKLSLKAKALRAAVASKGAASAGRVRSEADSVLLPMQKAMQLAAPTLGPPLGKPEQEKVQQQPLLLKGHLLELQQALDSGGGFDQYDSRSSGKTYAGGKVRHPSSQAAAPFLRVAPLARAERGARLPPSRAAPPLPTPPPFSRLLTPSHTFDLAGGARARGGRGDGRSLPLPRCPGDPHHPPRPHPATPRVRQPATRRDAAPTPRAATRAQVHPGIVNFEE